MRFSNNYTELYYSVPFDLIEWAGLYNTVCDEICSRGKVTLGYIIETESVTMATKCLKSGKSDGYDGLTSDNLINGSQLLFMYISQLFSCMVSHCCVPNHSMCLL